jgi:hypothetical protein
VTLTGFAGAGQRRLTVSETERLAQAALSDKTKRLPGFYLEPPPTPPKNGAMFDVLWGENPSDRVRAQSLVVDIDTGDVWDAIACQRLSTPAVESAQTVIRRELRIVALEVARARSQTQANGCSNLIDPRPKRSDFHSARVRTLDADKDRGSYRYSFSWGGCGYGISSPLPLDTRDGEVKFAIISNSMYVIDDHGAMREVQYQVGICI